MRAKIGILPTREVHKRMIDIAAGRIKPKKSDPTIYFSSMKSLSEVLSDNNRALLRIIADTKPENIKQLAEITGREQSNLSRTLKTFEKYGFVQMVKVHQSKKPIARIVDFDIHIAA